MQSCLHIVGGTLVGGHVGTDKDSEKRQRHAIQGFAKRPGSEPSMGSMTRRYPVPTRSRQSRGSLALLDRIEGNGVRTVIVEDASRFARELMAQELGITLLISRGVRLLTASGDDLTASDDPTRKMMRQIAGAFAEYEKARLVSKLRHARERVRQEKGKCQGRGCMASCVARLSPWCTIPFLMPWDSAWHDSRTGNASMFLTGVTSQVSTTRSVYPNEPFARGRGVIRRGRIELSKGRTLYFAASVRNNACSSLSLSG